MEKLHAPRARARAPKAGALAGVGHEAAAQPP